MGRFFLKRWFLVSLVVLIAVGLTLGDHLTEEHVKSLDAFMDAYQVPRLATALVLFLMAFSLDTRQLAASFRSPAPVMWGAAVNSGLIPLTAWPLMQMLLSMQRDFAVGLMIVASVPCTLAGASVWTRRANGNDAVSLMVTLVTNGMCFLITPFWLNLATSQTVNLDSGDLIVRLFQTVLVPTFLGQAVRQLPTLARLATKHKVAIGVAAQLMILVVVLVAAIESGTTLRSGATGIGIGAVVTIWLVCILLHLTAMVVGDLGGRTFGFRREDRLALLFASSQKTLPIGLLLATDPEMFGGAGIPFAVFPILMYHASQLFVDTIIADAAALKAPKPEPVKISESLLDDVEV